MPGLYDNYFINKYAFPKGLSTVRKPERDYYEVPRSIYDVRAQRQNTGIAGWKLSKGKPQ
jgi:hypothetical protein